MAKTTTKNVSVETLIVDIKTNVRLESNYEIPAMMQAIIDSGRINDPIHARLIDNVVLKGNRRTWAGQNLLADPNTPQELAATLKKTTVVFHDVVPGSLEELNIILDDGGVKTLCKTETLLAVWRMDKQFLSAAQIGMSMFMSLARYTGNMKKAHEAAAIANLKDRQAYITKWFHGTLGNYMLAVSKMGDYLRQQMVQTHLSEDNLLPVGEKVELRVTRDRVTQLSAAKSKDDLKNGGKGWSVVDGGENFNALIEKFKLEDLGQDTGEETAGKRPSIKDLRARAEVYKSPAISNALLVAAGDQDKARALVDLDDRLYRMDMVMETLTKRADEIADPKVKALVKAIIGTCPAGEVELCLNALVG